ncbi:MAG: ABC transporter permease [Clostridiales bacterium]|nr:ABC transporter permease [Clostridiales bacterium]
MLKLIKCEFMKLKRKKFVSFVVFSALLFPIPFSALILKGNVGDLNAFDSLYDMLFCMAVPIMLPCILGIIAAMLFYMERDNSTLKNLIVIPIQKWKIATSKIVVLYFIGLLFSCVTLLSSMVGGLIVGADLRNIGTKITIAAVTAILYTTGTLPIIIAIVKLNRSYIFAIILTFFYTMFGFLLAFTGQFTSDNQIMKVLTSILPTPIIYRWQASRLIEQGTTAFEVWQPYFLKLWIVALTIFILGGISYFAIIRIYQKQERQV